MPAITCAQSRDLTAHDIKNIGELTRENLRVWVDTNFGDFQNIDDFRADIGDFMSNFESVQSECIFNDCMYPSEG
jgi:phage host-nuclease inhibitor protein Gam